MFTSKPGWGGRRVFAAACALVGATLMLVLPALQRPPAALADYTYTFSEYTGGVTPGFSPNASPYGITWGSDGHIWFTELADPGRLARINDDGTVEEFTGGNWPGFSANTQPSGIALGGDGHTWFTEFHGPTGDIGGGQSGGRGGVGRINDDGTVTEYIGGLTPGFSTASEPGGGAAPGTVYQCPGIGLFSGGICPPDNTVWAPNPVPAPDGIFRGPDGNTWFTESSGRIGRVDGPDHVSEIVSGTVAGFSEGSIPSGLFLGEDDTMWFTEGWGPQGNVGPGKSGGRGGVGNLLGDGSVNERIGGLTAGFSVASYPQQISVGFQGTKWFTEGYGQNGRGGVGRINPDLSVTELVGGITSGFTANSQPTGITISLGDDAIWFLEGATGRVARVIDDNNVYEFVPVATPGFTYTGQPEQIVNGPNCLGNCPNGPGYSLWFTEAGEPGRIVHISISTQQEQGIPPTGPTDRIAPGVVPIPSLSISPSPSPTPTSPAGN